MALRYYVVEGCHPRRGWEFLGFSDPREKPCNDWAAAHTEKTGQVTRVKRMPKGWEP